MPVTADDAVSDPLTAVLQPANEYPDRVGAVDGRVTLPDQHSTADGAPVPPFALNVTV